MATKRFQIRVYQELSRLGKVTVEAETFEEAQEKAVEALELGHGSWVSANVEAEDVEGEEVLP